MVIPKVSNFDQKYQIFHVTTEKHWQKIGKALQIEIGQKIWNKCRWIRFQNFLIMLGIVHFQKPLELGVLTRAVPHGTLVWPHFWSTLKNSLLHRAAFIENTLLLAALTHWKATLNWIVGFKWFYKVKFELPQQFWIFLALLDLLDQ